MVAYNPPILIDNRKINLKERRFIMFGKRRSIDELLKEVFDGLETLDSMISRKQKLKNKNFIVDLTSTIDQLDRAIKREYSRGVYLNFHKKLTTAYGDVSKIGIQLRQGFFHKELNIWLKDAFNQVKEVKKEL